MNTKIVVHPITSTSAILRQPVTFTVDEASGCMLARLADAVITCVCLYPARQSCAVCLVDSRGKHIADITVHRNPDGRDVLKEAAAIAAGLYWEWRQANAGETS